MADSKDRKRRGCLFLLFWFCFFLSGGRGTGKWEGEMGEQGVKRSIDPQEVGRVVVNGVRDFVSNENIHPLSDLAEGSDKSPEGYTWTSWNRSTEIPCLCEYSVGPRAHESRVDFTKLSGLRQWAFHLSVWDSG